MCACLAVSVPPGLLVLLPRLASGVTLAVRADARDVIHISSYHQPVLNRRRACKALFLGAAMTEPLDALGHHDSHPKMPHPDPPVARGGGTTRSKVNSEVLVRAAPPPHLAPPRARFEGTATSGASRSPSAPRRPSRPRTRPDKRPRHCSPARGRDPPSKERGPGVEPGRRAAAPRHPGAAGRDGGVAGGGGAAGGGVLRGGRGRRDRGVGLRGAELDRAGQGWHVLEPDLVQVPPGAQPGPWIGNGSIGTDSEGS